jgi:hypothetical protein
VLLEYVAPQSQDKEVGTWGNQEAVLRGAVHGQPEALNACRITSTPKRRQQRRLSSLGLAEFKQRHEGLAQLNPCERLSTMTKQEFHQRTLTCARLPINPIQIATTCS